MATQLRDLAGDAEALAADGRIGAVGELDEGRAGLQQVEDAAHDRILDLAREDQQRQAGDDRIGPADAERPHGFHQLRRIAQHDVGSGDIAAAAAGGAPGSRSMTTRREGDDAGAQQPGGDAAGAAAQLDHRPAPAVPAPGAPWHRPGACCWVQWRRSAPGFFSQRRRNKRCSREIIAPSALPDRRRDESSCARFRS